MCHKKDEYKINSVNPLYLLVHRIDGFTEKKEGSKYLNIASTDRNSQVLKNMQKANQKEFRIEKVIKRKGNKLYVK